MQTVTRGSGQQTMENQPGTDPYIGRLRGKGVSGPKKPAEP